MKRPTLDMRRARRDMSLRKAASAGALAGLAGGLAMMVARKLEAKGLLGRDDSGEPEWDRFVRAEARRRNIRLSQARVTRIATALHLLYSAALGSTYGVVRSRSRLPSAVQGMVMSGLVYLAMFPSWGLMPRRGAARPPARQRARKALIPIGTHAVFGATTAAAFKALSGDAAH
ncbi:MAG TPA: hypothetical protein VJ596_04755 [Gemmatimonadaceae bacterium]|nr:hypothetical protein [Gemmatimonadaceae bacterium]